MSKNGKEKTKGELTLGDKLKGLNATLCKPSVKALINSVDSERFGVERCISQMIQMASDNQDILDCSHGSIIRAIQKALKFKLEPSSDLNFVYFIPYWNKDKGVSELSCELSYLGMIQLAYRANVIKAIDAGVIYEKDYFDYLQGSERYLKFRQNLTGDRGKKIGAFVVIDLISGNQVIEIVNMDDVAAFKKAADKGGKGPGPAWKQWEDQMIIKSTIKRALKKCPRIPELSDFENQGNVYDGESERIAEALAIEGPKATETPTEEQATQADQLAEMI